MFPEDLKLLECLQASPYKHKEKCSKKQYERRRGKQSTRMLMKRARGENNEFKTKGLARIMKVFYIVIWGRHEGRRVFV